MGKAPGSAWAALGGLQKLLQLRVGATVLAVHPSPRISSFFSECSTGHSVTVTWYPWLCSANARMTLVRCATISRGGWGGPRAGARLRADVPVSLTAQPLRLAAGTAATVGQRRAERQQQRIVRCGVAGMQREDHMHPLGAGPWATLRSARARAHAREPSLARARARARPGRREIPLNRSRRSMLAEEELVEHEAEVRVPAPASTRTGSGWRSSTSAQRRLEKLHQVMTCFSLRKLRRAGPRRGRRDAARGAGPPTVRQQFVPHLFALSPDASSSPRNQQDVVKQGAMLFAVCAPGLPPVTAEEVRALGLQGRGASGRRRGPWRLPEAMRLNLWLRTARPGALSGSRAVPRDRLSRAGAQGVGLLGSGSSAREPAVASVTCRKSRLYHSGAVAERLHAALEAQVGFPVPLAKAEGDEPTEDAQLFLARFERDSCTVQRRTPAAFCSTSAVGAGRRGRRRCARRWPRPLARGGTRGRRALLRSALRIGDCRHRAALIRECAGHPAAVASSPSRSGQNSRPRQWEHLISEPASRNGLWRCASKRPIRTPARGAAKENAARARVPIEVVQRRLAICRLNPGSDCSRAIRLTACASAPTSARAAEAGDAAKGRPRWRLAMVAGEAAAAGARELGSRLSCARRTEEFTSRCSFLREADPGPGA